MDEKENDKLKGIGTQFVGLGLIAEAFVLYARTHGLTGMDPEKIKEIFDMNKEQHSIDVRKEYESRFPDSKSDSRKINLINILTIIALCISILLLIDYFIRPQRYARFINAEWQNYEQDKR